MKNLLVVFILCNASLLFGQSYDVIHYEKITESMGGFDVELDAEDWLGYSVEFIGDLNNDSVKDIAVAALKDDDGGFNKGAVYILFMNLDGTVGTYQKISAAEGNFNGDLDEWDIFGSSIAYLGDINNDGLIEIGVGAEYDGDGGHWHGAAWILSLNSDGTVEDHSKISDFYGNFSANLGDEDVFGTDIALLGDLDGDSIQDIAVSARRDPDGGSDRGAVYILMMNPDLSVKSHQKISDTVGGFEGDLDGGDYFGGSIANIGDINNDGVIDLAIGAYRDDDGGANRGAVYILFMNADGSVQSHQKISDLEGNFDEEFNDEMFFGISIDEARDINEDGLSEIVVGARGYNNGEGPNFGAFYILNLNNDGTVESYVKYTEGLQYFDGDLEPGGSFGFSISYSNLFDDGYDGVVVGAFSDSEIGFQTGSFWTIGFGRILSIVAEKELESIFLYPNPTKTSFKVSNPTHVRHISVHASDGRQLVEFAPNHQNSYNLSYLPSGSYIVRIVFDDASQSSFRLLKG